MKETRRATPLLGLATLAALVLGLTATRPAAAQTPAFTPDGLGTRTNFYGTIGEKFTTGNSSVYVTQLGFYAPSALQNSHNVGIFQNGTLVGNEVTFTAGSGNQGGTGFIYQSVKAIILAPNSTYDILANMPENTAGSRDVNASDATLDPFLGNNNGVVKTPYGITYDNADYSYDYAANPGNTISTNIYGDKPGYFGPNFAYVPEPSSVAAFAFTGLGMMGLMLRARKARRNTAS